LESRFGPGKKNQEPNQEPTKKNADLLFSE